MIPVALDVFCEALIQLPSAIPLRTTSVTGQQNGPLYESWVQSYPL
jgi:hypothetical protein